MTEDISEDLQRKLKEIGCYFDQEDREIRERQLRVWRKLKLVWEGFQRVYYSEVAHDWRVYDDALTADSSIDQSYYDKPVNVFRAYLESIIAALSITVPPIKCFPDDADNSLDLTTAKGGDKIAELIYRHNNAPLLWLHALYVFVTEGLVACYSYPKSDKSYGTYDKPVLENVNEIAKFCPTCDIQLDEELFGPQVEDQFQPDSNVSPISCPNCQEMLPPDLVAREFTATRMTGVTKEPKTRMCLEVYGGLYVKVPIWAMKQSDIPYLVFSYETHVTNVLDRYPKLREKLVNQSGTIISGSKDEYEQWARLNPQYHSDIPKDTVTIRNIWLRPSAYSKMITDADVKELKDKYPDGCKLVLVNDLFAEACNENLDDYWTLTHNPLSDYLQHDPLGLSLTGIQEITNDLISLVIQTIEHGIPQTFIDDRVVNFDAYRQTEVMPGAIYPAKAQTGKSVSDGFHEVKTATLSQEVLPFFEQIQQLGQLISGALPSLFGGNLEGSGTASEYSMSRAQALQRLQNTWKMFTIWWKEIFAKVIPMYIDEMVEDERYVQRTMQGGFINVFIRKSELSGEIGQVELEANENLPITWQQKKDVIMQLFETNNPAVLEALGSPENLPLLYDAVGLTNFHVPGENDRAKQNDEIKLLAVSEPLQVPLDPVATEVAMTVGAMPPMTEIPSVEIEPLVDNHNVHAEVCREYLISEAGRLLKIDNPLGYKNILLHLQAHMMELAKITMPEEPNPEGQENQEKPKGSASPLMKKDQPNVQA